MKAQGSATEGSWVEDVRVARCEVAEVHKAAKLSRRLLSLVICKVGPNGPMHVRAVVLEDLLMGQALAIAEGDWRTCHEAVGLNLLDRRLVEGVIAKSACGNPAKVLGRIRHCHRSR